MEESCGFGTTHGMTDDHSLNDTKKTGCPLSRRPVFLSESFVTIQSTQLTQAYPLMYTGASQHTIAITRMYTKGETMVSIDRMEQMLEQIAEEFPPEFFARLNGGICLLPEVKYSPHARQGDLCILGEYHYNMMGRYIYIYYGSFCRVHGGLDEAELYEELRRTVAHEFTHHMENLAGERGLEIQDELDLEDYLYRDK